MVNPKVSLRNTIVLDFLIQQSKQTDKQKVNLVLFAQALFGIKSSFFIIFNKLFQIMFCYLMCLLYR